MNEAYALYLNSHLWAEMRAKVLIRDKYRCQTCFITEALEVHHRTYQRIFNEDLDDLITLCRDCHGAITNIIQSRKAAGKRRVSPPYTNAVDWSDIYSALEEVAKTSQTVVKVEQITPVSGEIKDAGNQLLSMLAQMPRRGKGHGST